MRPEQPDKGPLPVGELVHITRRRLWRARRPAGQVPDQSMPPARRAARARLPQPIEHHA